ncbi:dihydrolipoyl dehydrogenase [Myxococcota bacterium]|nr:dihydrolipoyl dehydrogenase [Myxococcota bacterium]
MNGEAVEIRVPTIGDFEDVEVIEILVAPGDSVVVEQSLITLESDKATMEIPSPHEGVVAEVFVELGARVSEGKPILSLQVSATDASTEAGAPRAEPEPVSDSPTTESSASGSASSESKSAAMGGRGDLDAEVVVLGGGPGGYTAAFRAADLGKKVVLVERYETLGGVCLNVGCIPSKALLHVSDVMTEARALADHGVDFGEPTLDLDRLRGHKNGVVEKLTSGLAGLARRRKVEVVRGEGRFTGPNRMDVTTPEGSRLDVAFDNAIIAVGSQAVRLPGFPDDPRIMDSTRALELADVPERLAVIGGGIIGLEMAGVYHALGSKVTIIELLDALMDGADADLVEPLGKIIRNRYENIFLGTRVTGVELDDTGVRLSLDGPEAPDTDRFDRVLMSVGRRPNGAEIDAHLAGVEVDERNFIPVDDQQRTNVSHIYAIGDVTGPPMLAHKATHEGRVAAEVIAGLVSSFLDRTIPSVAYTDPEVAWMGLTEAEASERGIEVRKASFPWAASGRALGVGRSEGRTKLLFEPEGGRLLGAGMVGPNAGELIAETVLAYEMGADAEDIALTIHAHPTLSETVAMSAEMAEGTITDLYVPKRR